MSKYKKKKKKPTRRYLTRGERAVYIILIALTIAFSLASIPGLMHIQQNLIATDEAFIVRETASVLWLLIPIMPLLCFGLAFLFSGYQGGVPLFKIGEEKKRKPDKYKRGLIIIIAALWLISWIPAIGALYNRTELTPTHCNRYAMFGSLKESRPLSDVDSVEARIYYGKSGWRLGCKIFFSDGYDFYAEPGSRKTILLIEEYLPDVPITLEGAKNFDKLCREYDMSKEETEKLKEILEIE